MRYHQDKQSRSNILFMVVLSILSLIAGLIFLADKVLAWLAGGG